MEKRKNILIGGAIGCGKTTLAGALAAAFPRSEVIAMDSPVRNLRESIEGGIGMDVADAVRRKLKRSVMFEKAVARAFEGKLRRGIGACPADYCIVDWFRLPLTRLWQNDEFFRVVVESPESMAWQRYYERETARGMSSTGRGDFIKTMTNFTVNHENFRPIMETAPRDFTFRHEYDTNGLWRENFDRLCEAISR